MMTEMPEGRRFLDHDNGDEYAFVDPAQFPDQTAVPDRVGDRLRATVLRSQNGWTANDRSAICSWDVPGGKVALRVGNAGYLLAACFKYWHEYVEPLVWPGIWGYAERLVRGSSTDVSNHASGTAGDANAPQHPLGTAPTANFSAAEIAAIHWMIEWLEGAVRWGGDYTGRKDGMHVEIDAGPAEVDRVAAKLRANGGVIPGPGGATPTPTPTPVPAPALPATAAPVPQGGTCRKGDTGPGVVLVQQLLTDRGYDCGGVDGDFGDATDAALRDAQGAMGVAVDGVAGAETQAALWKIPNFPGIARPGDMNSPAVTAFQQRLHDRKWKGNGPDGYIAVDGDYTRGGETQRCMTGFQSEKGLRPVDGIGGPDTWAALYTR